MRNFSSKRMLQPGDCSPSRSVVSKMVRRVRSIAYPPGRTRPKVKLLE